MPDGFNVKANSHRKLIVTKGNLLLKRHLHCKQPSFLTKINAYEILNFANPLSHLGFW